MCDGCQCCNSVCVCECVCVVCRVQVSYLAPLYLPAALSVRSDPCVMGVRWYSCVVWSCPGVVSSSAVLPAAAVRQE